MIRKACGEDPSPANETIPQTQNLTTIYTLLIQTILQLLSAYNHLTASDGHPMQIDGSLIAIDGALMEIYDPLLFICGRLMLSHSAPEPIYIQLMSVRGTLKPIYGELEPIYGDQM